MASVITKTKFDVFLDDKYIPLEKKNKLLALAAILLAPVLLFYFSLYQPKVQKIKNTDNKITSIQNEITKVKKQAAGLKALEARVKSIQLHFDEIAEILPKEQEIPDLLRAISDTGKNSGLEFLSFKPNQELARDFYAEIPIDISTLGTYHNLGGFLDEVSKLERLVTVNNISITRPRDAREGVQLLNSGCRLITYRFTNIKTQQQQ